MRSWHSTKGTISSQMTPHSVKNEQQIITEFNENGRRLVAADFRGIVTIWNCKPDGAMKLLYTFKISHGCSHLTFLNIMDKIGTQNQTSTSPKRDEQSVGSGEMEDDLPFSCLFNKYICQRTCNGTKNRRKSQATMLYISSGDGRIYLTDDLGNCDEVLSLEDALGEAAVCKDKDSSRFPVS